MRWRRNVILTYGPNRWGWIQYSEFSAKFTAMACIMHCGSFDQSSYIVEPHHLFLLSDTRVFLFWFDENEVESFLSTVGKVKPFHGSLNGWPRYNTTVDPRSKSLPNGILFLLFKNGFVDWVQIERPKNKPKIYLGKIK